MFHRACHTGTVRICLTLLKRHGSSDLINAMETKVAWPRHLLHVWYVLLTKPSRTIESGEERPIGLLRMLVRVWESIRRPRLAIWCQQRAGHWDARRGQELGHEGHYPVHGPEKDSRRHCDANDVAKFIFGNVQRQCTPPHTHAQSAIAGLPVASHRLVWSDVPGSAGHSCERQFCSGHPAANKHGTRKWSGKSPGKSTVVRAPGKDTRCQPFRHGATVC